MPPKDSLRVVALKIRDFKRIEAFEATIDAGLVVLSGPNGSGKSAVLDSIVAALGGKRSCPSDPVRHGAVDAEILLDLDPYTIRRTFRPDGYTALAIARKDGLAVSSPQAFLDDLCPGAAFDPMAPLRERPERLAEILRALAGLDFRELDGRRAHLYAGRTEVNRSLRVAETSLRLMPHNPGLPDEFADVQTMRLNQRSAFDLHGKHERLAAKAKMIEDDIERTARLIADLESRLAAERAAAERLCGERDQAIASLDRFSSPDLQAIADRIEAADERNRRVAENRDRAKAESRAAEQRARAEELTEEIEAIDREKADRLSAARFPVAGLAVDDDGVLLDGVPIAQASSGQRIELGLAIAAAQHPQLRTVLVREGSLLDPEALRRVASFARENDLDVLLEVVSAPGDEPAGAIIIIDGHRVDVGSMPMIDPEDPPCLNPPGGLEGSSFRPPARRGGRKPRLSPNSLFEAADSEDSL